MNESIQQLTEKIYLEGVEKAEARSAQLLDEAAQRARQIVDEAEAKARQIITNAEQKAIELKQKHEAEMRISARQALADLKQRITQLVIWQLNHEPVHKAIDDTAFMQNLISKLMDYWLANFGKEDHLRILLPQDEYEAYRSYLEERTAEILGTGISFKFNGDVQHGFQVEAVDRGFRINFSDEDFENYFSNFARPRIHKLLFGKED